jgi:O-antigen/teichoic acid export membrane protein
MMKLFPSIVSSVFKADCKGALRFSVLFRRNGFGRLVFTLMTGTAIAQAVSVLATPILGRLYHPEDFGVFAMFVTVLLVTAPVVCARYELAIVPAENDDDAFGLFLLSCIVSLLFGILIFLSFQNRQLLQAIGLGPVIPYSAVVVFGVILNGIYQALLQFATRERRFRHIAKSQMLQSGGGVVFQASAGASTGLGPAGLIWGQIVGTSIAFLAVGRGLQRSWLAWRERHARNSIRALREVAIAHKNHPIFLPWGGFLNALAQKMPVLMLSAFYGPFFLGLYSIADRLLRTPAMLIGQSSSQVLFQKMTEPYMKANMPRLIVVWTVGMTLISAVPFTLFYFFSRPLFSFILGPKWAAAGALAAVLIPIYWGILVVSPISTILIIANRQALLVSIQALILSSSFGSLWLGHRWFADGAKTLLLYSVVQCGVYIVYYCALWSTAKSMARKQTQVAATRVA